jgi:hypothetical protein
MHPTASREVTHAHAHVAIRGAGRLQRKREEEEEEEDECHAPSSPRRICRPTPPERDTPPLRLSLSLSLSLSRRSMRACRRAPRRSDRRRLPTHCLPPPQPSLSLPATAVCVCVCLSGGGWRGGKAVDQACSYALHHSLLLIRGAPMLTQCACRHAHCRSSRPQTPDQQQCKALEQPDQQQRVSYA